MCQNAFAARAPPRAQLSWGAYSAPPDPLARFGEGKLKTGIERAMEVKGMEERKGRERKKGRGMELGGSLGHWF